MAQISFYAGENFAINNLAGSGLGFYGGGFGYSVPVGEYQDSTFITDSNGTSQGPQVDNVKYQNAQSGILNGASSGINILNMPNYLASLNIRFTHSTAVKTQNAKLRIYDRLSINNNPSGVTCKVAELVHPSTSQLVTGSGSTTWSTPTGSSVVLSATSSPGISGQRPNGANTSATDHDWYFGISASPDSIGSKTNFGLYFECEYF